MARYNTIHLGFFSEKSRIRLPKTKNTFDFYTKRKEQNEEQMKSSNVPPGYYNPNRDNQTKHVQSIIYKKTKTKKTRTRIKQTQYKVLRSFKRT